MNRRLPLTAMAAVVLGFASLAIAKPDRSSTAVAEFKRLHPCPANGATKGKCPGYIVDHVIPLCAGGADAPSNMQWQTVPDAKAKDRDEQAQCRAARRSRSQ